MSDLGARLRNAREARGVSLRDIATRTKISVGTLEALERNDYSRLPGGIFGRAFVRAYALEIGVDADEAVTDFQAQLEQSEREAAERGAIRAEISQDDRDFLAKQRLAIRTLRVAIVLLVLFVGAGVTWYLRASRHSTAATDLIATAPPVPVPSPNITEPPPAPAEPAAPTMMPPAPIDSPPPAPTGLAIDLQVTGDCWIAIDVDGQRTASRVFRPGDRQQLSARESVVLDVGNAGAVVWTINGKPGRPLGKSGAHVHVTITPARASEYVQP